MDIFTEGTMVTRFDHSEFRHIFNTDMPVSIIHFSQDARDFIRHNDPCPHVHSEFEPEVAQFESRSKIMRVAVDNP